MIFVRVKFRVSGARYTAFFFRDWLTAIIKNKYVYVRKYKVRDILCLKCGPLSVDQLSSIYEFVDAKLNGFHLSSTNEFVVQTH